MFTLPENIAELTREQLAELRQSALDRYNDLRDGEQDSATTAELTRIAEALEKVTERVAELDAEAAARSDAVAKIEALAKAQAEAEQEKATEPEPESAPSAEPESAPSAEPAEAVTASRAMSVADIAATTPVTPAPTDHHAHKPWYASLTAGAELKEVPAGAGFKSGHEVAQALTARTRALTQSRSDVSVVVANAHLEGLTVVTQATGASATNMAMLQAIDEYRLGRGNPERDALTAAGFCGPCETLTDFCEPEVADQLIDLPTIGIGSGCLEYYPGFDFSGFDDHLFEFCGDELAEGVEKPCPELPCPEPVREEACVIGACATVDIVTNAAWPEMVERQIRGILKRHQIRISNATLRRMEEGSTPVLYTDDLIGGRGFTAALLAAIEVQAEDIRADSYLGLGDTVRVVMDRWVRGAIRADLVNRTGVDLLSVTNSRIDDMFRAIGVSVTWVKNWQANHIGQPGAQTAYPDSVKFLIYRDGAWVRGLDPVIELHTQYDSALLKKNKFTRLFTEQSFLVVNMCGDSRVVEVPVCPSGTTAALSEAVCFSEPAEDNGGEGEGE